MTGIIQASHATGRNAHAQNGVLPVRTSHQRRQSPSKLNSGYSNVAGFSWVIRDLASGRPPVNVRL